MARIQSSSFDGQDVLTDDNAGTLTKYQNGPGIDNKLRTQSGTTVNYFLADHLGSTNGLTDSTGALTSQTAYDSFGNQTGNLATRYGFTGRERDDFTGLMYYRARFYDPNLGRLISEDPIGFGGGDVNLYGYVWNSPYSYTDPSGLSIRGVIARAVKSLSPNKLGPGIGSVEDAADLANRGEDILATNRGTARDIATAMDPSGRRPVHDPAHGPANEGYRPHYHAHGRPKGAGHIFYNLLPILAPNTALMSDSACTTNPQLGSALLWDGRAYSIQPDLQTRLMRIPELTRGEADYAV